jgi:hypothetical protein
MANDNSSSVLSEQDELGPTILSQLVALTGEVKAMRSELDRLSRLLDKSEAN